MNYIIFWSRKGTGKERRLPYTMSKEVADKLCQFLNETFPEYIHEVREVYNDSHS